MPSFLETVALDLERLKLPGAAKQLRDAEAGGATSGEVLGRIGAVLEHHKALRRLLSEPARKAWDSLKSAADRANPRPASRAFAILFPGVFVVLGGLIVAQALGLGQFVGKALVPNWVLGLAGCVFLFGGLAFGAKFLGFSDKVSQFFGYGIVLSLAAVFHYSVFVDDLSRWSGTSFGSLSAGHLTRIVVVAADFFFIGMLILARKPRSRPVLAGLLVAPLAIAVTLHYTGVLDRAGAAFGQRVANAPRLIVTQGVLKISAVTEGRPHRPLPEFVGRWNVVQPAFMDTGWVTRVEVLGAAGKPRLALWRRCRAGECFDGEYEARVDAAPKSNGVHALHAAGKLNGMDWTFALRAQSSAKVPFMADERHIRGADWNTHQQGGGYLRRP